MNVRPAGRWVNASPTLAAGLPELAPAQSHQPAILDQPARVSIKPVLARFGLQSLPGGLPGYSAADSCKGIAKFESLHLQVDRLSDNGLLNLRYQRTRIYPRAAHLRLRHHDFKHAAVYGEHLLCALPETAAAQNLARVFQQGSFDQWDGNLALMR